MRVEETIEIDRPIEEVWALVADPANDPRWCSKVAAVEPAGAGRWRVTHKPVPLRPPLAMILEQTEVEPPLRLSMRAEDDASIFRVEYRLDSTPAGTRFTQTSEFEWKRLPRLLHGTFSRGVRRDVRGQLKALKRLLEARGSRIPC